VATLAPGNTRPVLPVNCLDGDKPTVVNLALVLIAGEMLVPALVLKVVELFVTEPHIPFTALTTTPLPVVIMLYPWVLSLPPLLLDLALYVV